MHLRNLFALALVAAGLAASSAFAATVTFTLDLTVDDQWEARASTSAGDNGGITTYGIPLNGSVLSVDHRSPNVFKTGPNGNSGFSNLRSADDPDGGANPTFTGAQDLATPNLVYGFGQAGGTFTGTFFPNDATADTTWLAPLVIARGTYERDSALSFNTGAATLLANVFDQPSGNNRISATVATVVLPFGGGVVNLPPVVDEEPDESNPNTTGAAPGSNIATTFTATDATSLPLAFSNAVLSSFVPQFPGATNPAFNGTVAANGNFTWNTQGFARGVYEIDVTATDSGDPALSGSGGNFLVTIEQVPEPSTLALFGLAMVGGLGVIRRRNG